MLVDMLVPNFYIIGNYDSLKLNERHKKNLIICSKMS